uniref:Uncharacterized protein n=1 Tax=Anguilla anguilla TaxID=7936 RepID=A0A0E9WMT6_ANGAN
MMNKVHRSLKCLYSTESHWTSQALCSNLPSTNQSSGEMKSLIHSPRNYLDGFAHGGSRGKQDRVLKPEQDA